MENKIISFPSPTKISKGWGFEQVIINSDKFAGKLLVYDKAGATSSSHYHLQKSETFYVFSGEFKLNFFNLKNADVLSRDLKEGDVVDIPSGNPHQIICVSPGTIIEFSTTDSSEDNYRIIKGDSQATHKSNP